MRLSELAAKRIINLFDGELIGSAGDSDLVIEPVSGLISELIVPGGRGRGRQPEICVPWQAVRKIGREVVVVDIEK